MLAFHNDPSIKQKYLDRVEMHRKADELVHGQYWEHGKGCAVGCTIHGSDHNSYEAELGIPATLAYLEDALFENMPKESAQEWPGKFLQAIPVGADLSMVVPHFLFWVLGDEKDGVIALVDQKEFPDCHAAVVSATALQQRLLNGEKIEDSERAAEAARAARAARAAEAARAARAAEAAEAARAARAAWAAWAAWAAEAAEAAWAAWAAEAAEAAEAAWAARAAEAAEAAWAARAAEAARAAWAARAAEAAEAAWAARAAEAAEAAWAARAPEERKRALQQSEKLLELLAAAPVPADARCEQIGK